MSFQHLARRLVLMVGYAPLALRTMAWLIYFRHLVSHNRTLPYLQGDRIGKITATYHPILAHRYRRMVQAVSRWVPGQRTCLIEALTLRRVLIHRHIPGSLHLGVDRTGRDQLLAHAWVIAGEEILLGGAEAGRFHEVARFTW